VDTLTLKQDAKEKLRGNYIEIVSAMILIYAIVILFFSINNILENAFIMAVIEVILSGFLLMGLVTMVMKIAKGEQTSLEDLFSKTNIFFKTVALTIVTSIIIGVFVTFLGVALYGLYTSSGLWGICDDWIVTSLICIGIVLSMALLVFTAYVTLSFSLVFFIYHDNPKMSIYDILKQSYKLMDGRKLDLFILIISFAGWILLGALTLGLLYLWLIPYMLVAITNFYIEIAPKKRKRAKTNNKEEKDDQKKSTIKKKTTAKKRTTKKTVKKDEK